MAGCEASLTSIGGDGISRWKNRTIVRAQSKPAASRDNLSGGRGDRRRRARCRYSLCGHKLAVAGRTSGTALTVRRYLIANRAGVTQKVMQPVARGTSGAWLHQCSPKNAGGDGRIGIDM